MIGVNVALVLKQLFLRRLMRHCFVQESSWPGSLIDELIAQLVTMDG